MFRNLVGELTNVNENRKQAVSIRLSTGDVRKIKRLAERLGVRDSDVIRFAVKSTLQRLAPLCDPEIRGRNLVPLFVEGASDLIVYFDLDAFRLESIVNEGADEERQVEHEDIQMLAMSVTQQPYLKLRLGGANGADGASERTAESLRQYLYRKYVYRAAEPRNGRDTTAHELFADAVGR